MNPEQAAMRSIDRSREKRLELSPRTEKAYDKARMEVLRDPDYVIQETEFEGVYDKATIDSDVALGKRLERQFAERRTPQEENIKKVADLFEAIMLMQTEMNNWLGQNASTLKTSRFDDYINKVDMVAEWSSPEEGSRILALAIDITFGVQSIQKKLADIRHEIEAGQLGSIRYFRDQEGNFMGTRKNVARTVIGISQPVIEELAGLWLDNKNRSLGSHPIQRVIIDQINLQLAAMEQYALKLDKPDVALAYRSARATIGKVRAEKLSISAGSLANDPVALEITQQTKKQFSS